MLLCKNCGPYIGMIWSQHQPLHHHHPIPSFVYLLPFPVIIINIIFVIVIFVIIIIIIIIISQQICLTIIVHAYVSHCIQILF